MALAEEGNVISVTSHHLGLCGGEMYPSDLKFKTEFSGRGLALLLSILQSSSDFDLSRVEDEEANRATKGPADQLTRETLLVIDYSTLSFQDKGHNAHAAS